MFYEDQHKLAAYLERTGAEWEYKNIVLALWHFGKGYNPVRAVHQGHPIRPVLRHGLPSHLQSEIHNPDNLTEEQICEGGKYRAVVESELIEFGVPEYWTGAEWLPILTGPFRVCFCGQTVRLPADVPWPDWKQEEAAQPDPKDARIAELENLLKIPEGLTRYVKELEAQLAASPWRRMSEVPTEEDADEEGRILTFFLGKASSCVIHYTALNSRYHTAWMPVPKFHGWPDPLADLLKAHGVEVTPEILAALTAWKGVEK